jgi:hypothetical protein
MGASDMSFVLVAATNWPGSPANNFAVCIDRGTPSEEKILCSSNTGTTVVVVTRGIDGTSATTHQATASVFLCAISTDFDEANQVSNLLGNAAAGSLIIGAGAATLPTKLAVGSAASVLAGGTTPTWVSASNGQYFGVSGGGVTAITPPTVTQLTPIAKSSSYAATNGQFVNCTATLTVTSPAAAADATFGAIANYGASNASPVTLTTASGYFIGPGIPASTASILLGAVNAQATFISDGTNWYLTGGAQDSGWVTVSVFSNSWAYYSANNGVAYRRIGNIVKLTGVVQSGASNATAFTLPTGFRPVANAFGNLQLPCQCMISTGYGTGGIAITDAGAVTPQFTGTLSWIALDSSFTVD